MDDLFRDDPVQSKLDRIMEKIDKFDLWKEETDRRLENRDTRPTRDTDHPWSFDEGDELEYDDYRRRKLAERGYHHRNRNYGQRDDPTEERGRRD